MTRTIKLLLFKVNMYGRNLFMHIQQELEDEPSGKINTGSILKSQNEKCYD